MILFYNMITHMECLFNKRYVFVNLFLVYIILYSMLVRNLFDTIYDCYCIYVCRLFLNKGIKLINIIGFIA